MGEDFFLLEEGAASAHILLHDGAKQVVRQYGAGDYFGELALLHNKPRGATVVATTPTVRGWSRSRFFFARWLDRWNGDWLIARLGYMVTTTPTARCWSLLTQLFNCLILTVTYPYPASFFIRSASCP